MTLAVLDPIRGLFDYLVTGGIIPFNPASSVRGPGYTIKRGKTPVLNGISLHGTGGGNWLLDCTPTRTIRQESRRHPRAARRSRTASWEFVVAASEHLVLRADFFLGFRFVAPHMGARFGLGYRF